MKKRLSFIIVGFLVLSAMTVAAGLWYRACWPERFAVVTPGVLYRSAQPDGEQIAFLSRHYHIRTVVNLRAASEMERDRRTPSEIESAQSQGIRFVSLPASVQPSAGIVRQFLAIMADPGNWPVLIHCHEGQMRTGTLIVAYRVADCNWSTDRAIGEARTFGLTEKRKEFPEIYRFLEHFSPSQGTGASVQ